MNTQTNGTNGHAAVPLEEKARASAGATSTIVPSIALWNQGSRIGGALTPQQIANIIRDGDTGDTRRLVDLANECRQTDSHLHAVLATREESISGLPWQIVPPADKPRAKDKRAAQWCSDVLRGNAAFQRLLADLAGSFFYGFAYAEIIWRKDNGRLVPDRFNLIAPRRFIFRREDGALVLCDSGSTETELAAKHPNKFIVAQPRVNGDVPNREGLCRPLVWMSAMKRWDVGDWIHCGEMTWKPYRIGTYKQSAASPEGAAGRQDVRDLETVIRRLTTDYTAVIPDSTSIRVEWPSGSASRASTHAELLRALNDEMSKAVLGQTETTQSSKSSGYAQAKVHNEVKRDLLEAAARYIASVITRDLLGAMVRLNFGTSVTVPRFEFVTREAPDLKAFSEALTNLVGVGLQVPQKWVRDESGIPEPTDGEEVLATPTSMPTNNQPNGTTNSGEGNDEAPAEMPAHDPKASIPVLQRGLRMLGGHPVIVSMGPGADVPMVGMEEEPAGEEAEHPEEP